MSQTTIPANLTVAIKGALADASPHDIESWVNADTLSIPFGAFVAQDSGGDKAVSLPNSSADIIVGMAVHHHDIAPAFASTGDLDATGIVTKAPVPVARWGRFYTVAEVDVLVNDPVFVRYAAGAGGSQLGAVRKATVSMEMIDLTKVARFRTTALAGALVVVEFDFRNLP